MYLYENPLWIRDLDRVVDTLPELAAVGCPKAFSAVSR